MLVVGLRSGCTFWIIWLRRPRLYSAEASVAVLTVLNLSRVSGCSVMDLLRSVDHRFGDRRAEFGAQEIEVAAFVGLLDVLGEHPAIAAFETCRGRCPFRAPAGQFRVGYLHADAAGVDVDADDVAGA